MTSNILKLCVRHTAGLAFVAFTPAGEKGNRSDSLNSYSSEDLTG